MLRRGTASRLAIGVVACVCGWAVTALWAAPLRSAGAARLDGRGAVYLSQSDPLLHRSLKLTGSEASGEGEFGHSVALSPDGTTALVGASDENGRAGGAWVFTRSGSTWTQQGPELRGIGETGEGSFGSSVALSADGNIALIGGRSDDAAPHEGCCGAGAVWVFTRTGSTWSQQGAKLTPGTASRDAEFGSSVALSANGRTAVIGAPGSAQPGAAWVFTRSGSQWERQAVLGSAAATPYAGFGNSVALSASGNTALVGAEGARGGGAAWIFRRSRSKWTKEGAKLTGMERGSFARFGDSTALSGNGTTALVGAGGEGGEVGAAWLFTRSGSAWKRRAKLTGRGESGRGNFGESLALSFNGDTALIGAAMDNEGNRERVGAAWLFARSGSSWIQRGVKFTGRGGAEDGLFAASLALSGDGDTALIGGDGANAAWIYEGRP